MQTFRFRALVTLDAAAADVPASHYASGAHMIIVKTRPPGEPGFCRDFPAAMCRDDEVPLRPGDRAVVTITLAADGAGALFRPGQSFTLWDGSDIGHGVISRRVFTASGPC